MCARVFRGWRVAGENTNPQIFVDLRVFCALSSAVTLRPCVSKKPTHEPIDPYPGEPDQGIPMIRNARIGELECSLD